MTPEWRRPSRRTLCCFLITVLALSRRGLALCLFQGLDQLHAPAGRPDCRWSSDRLVGQLQRYA